jgi:hypothetical protein
MMPIGKIVFLLLVALLPGGSLLLLALATFRALGNGRDRRSKQLPVAEHAPSR